MDGTPLKDVINHEAYSTPPVDANCARGPRNADFMRLSVRTFGTPPNASIIQKKIEQKKEHEFLEFMRGGGISMPMRRRCLVGGAGRRCSSLRVDVLGRKLDSGASAGGFRRGKATGLGQNGAYVL